MMFSIIEHIEYLITRHDCVVVPGWGAFIANYNHARYDDGQSVMKSPSRVVAFNANLAHNDGLLAHSLMRREGLSYNDAIRFIADSVTVFRQQLSMGGEVSMGRIGYFRRTQGRYIEFVPFAHSNASDDFFGLADMSIKTVNALEQEQSSQDESVQAPAAIVVPKERRFFSRQTASIAASVAVLIGLGVVLSTPTLVNRDNHHKASMAPTVTAPQAQQLGGVSVQEGVVAQPIEVVEPSSPTIASVGNESGHYYMVIATLRNQQELDAFKRDNQSLVPYMKILDYKGLMCVYVARSDDYGTLMGLRDQLPERLRSVWIYS